MVADFCNGIQATPTEELSENITDESRETDTIRPTNDNVLTTPERPRWMSKVKLYRNPMIESLVALCTPIAKKPCSKISQNTSTARRKNTPMRTPKDPDKRKRIRNETPRPSGTNNKTIGKFLPKLPSAGFNEAEDNFKGNIGKMIDKNSIRKIHFIY